jgi:hypothetical protein
MRSGVPPKALSDGSVVWGYNAPYAEDVEEGTPPHWIEDIEPLKGWARRVLGDEQLAYPVRRSIAKFGTKPQPYAEPGVDTMKMAIKNSELKPFLEEEL